MNDPINWMSWDHTEAKGDIGIRADYFGLGIYVRDPSSTDGARQIALVDLFYQSRDGKDFEHGEHIAIALGASADELGFTHIARLLDGGRRVIVEQEGR